MSSVAVELDLQEVADGVIVRPMLTVDAAIDLWLGHLARIGRATRTRDSYCRYLDMFADRFPRGWDVAKVTTEDCEAFLDRWSHRTASTRSAVYTPVNGLFEWLYHTRKIKTDPMEFVDPPLRQRPEDLDVTTVTSAEVRRLLAYAETWRERLAIAIPAYTGARRTAAARLRLTDYDQAQQLLHFKEKGGKSIWKPVPHKLGELLEQAIAEGEILYPDGYLIPAGGPIKGDRDSRVVLNLVKAVAKRAGVDAHVHALRAAFACFYLETHEGDTHALQELMGHRSADTTRIYLRKLDKRVVMERVRDLSWDNAPSPVPPQSAGNAIEGKGVAEKEGFEPSFEVTPLRERDGTEPEGAETPRMPRDLGSG